METRQTLLVDAFTDEPATGNPTGLIPDASDLADDQCRAVAAELGASATAVLEPSASADRRLRVFSPESEVDLHGTATVAVHAHLFERGVIDEGSHAVETGSGDVAVDVEADGTAWTDAPTAEVERADVDHEDAAAALGIDVAALRDVGADLPTSRATCGESVLVVPVNYFEHLSAIDPDHGAVADVCAHAQADRLCAFTFDTIDGDSAVHVRSFTPEADRREDPASGFAAGACAAYLRRNTVLDDETDEVVVEQGHFLDRPGRVRVVTDGHSVRIGGRAVTTLDGDLVVPEADEDDILEV